MIRIRPCVLSSMSFAFALLVGAWSPVAAQSRPLPPRMIAVPLVHDGNGGMSLSIQNEPLTAAGIEVVGIISLTGAHTSGYQLPVRYPVGTALRLEWDPYTAQEIADSQVSRYDIEITGPQPGTASVTLATLTFNVPKLPLGAYSIGVKGCTAASVCSVPTTIAFVIDPIIPPAPRGPRLVPVTEPVTLDQAATMAHSYKALLDPKRPRLSDTEMQWLVARWVQQVGPDGGSQPLTHGNVLTFLDRVALELTQR